MDLFMVRQVSMTVNDQGSIQSYFILKFYYHYLLKKILLSGIDQHICPIMISTEYIQL